MSSPTVRTALRHEAIELLLGFARALRAAGLPVSADRERAFLAAVAEVGLDDQAGAYWAGRATLCAQHEDIARFDRVYAAWFGGERGVRAAPSPHQTRTLQAALEDDLTAGEDATRALGDEQTEAALIRARASDLDLLRHRDVGTLSQAEKARLANLFATLTVAHPRRRARRHRAATRGRVDARATLRDQLRRMGEPGPVRWRRPAQRARRIVLLVDVSGSMSAYADSLLRLAHRVVVGGGPVEVFTMGTRLTRVTDALRRRDPELALTAVGAAVPDWSGGTRLAESLDAFVSRWGRRGLARGAVVVVCSDGWERDHPEALGQSMARLAVLAHRVIWANPHAGRADYLPVQSGIVAALEHCDTLVAGHSLAAFQRLLVEVAHA